MADERIRFVTEADNSSAINAIDNLVVSVQKGEDAFQDLSSTATASMVTAGDSVNDFNTKLLQNKKIIQDLERELIKLQKEYQDLKNSGRSVDAVNKRIQALKTQLQSARLDTKQLQSDFKQANVALSNFGVSMNRSTGQIRLNSQAAANLSFQLQDVFVQLASGQGIIRTLVQQAPQITSIFGGFGNTMKALGQFTRNTLKDLVSFRRETGRGRRALRGLAFAGAAAIAVPLAAYFARTGEIAERFERVISGIANGVNSLITRLAFLGEAIANLFSGRTNFSEFAAEATRAMAGLSDSIVDSYNEASEATRRLQEIKKVANEAEIGRIRSLATAQRARKFAEDETKLVSERIELLRTANAIEQQARVERAATLRQILAAQQDRNDSESELFETRKEIAELEAEISTATIESSQEINDLLNERIERQKELSSILVDAAARLSGPAAEARVQFDRALDAIEDLKEEARLLGSDLDFGNLEILAAEEFKRAKDAAFGELKKIPTLLSNGEIPDRIKDSLASYETDFTEAGLAYNEKLAQGIEQNDSFLEALENSLQEAFNLTESEFNFLIDSIGFSFEELSTSLTADIDRQISEQDRLIESIKQRVDRTTELLEQEQERANQGRANSLEQYKNLLEKQVQEQEQAENKRLELEKKAARQRLFINSTERASQLALAAAKLTAAEAGKGIIGLGLALAGLALIRSIVSQSNAINAQFEVPGFWKGTKYVDGPGSYTSDSIVARLSKGERVLTADQNKKVGSVENDDLVSTYKVGKFILDHPEVLMTDFSEFITSALNDSTKIAQLQFANHTKILADEHRKAIQESTSELIEYWSSRPIEYLDGNGNRIIERKTGGVIHRQTLKSK